MHPFVSTPNMKEALYKEVNLPATVESILIDKLSDGNHRYLRDLQQNVSNALQSQNLSYKELLIIAFGVAINEKCHPLITSFEALLKAEGLTQEALGEITGCVSLMNANTVFYRFRQFINKEYYERTPAGIKMGIMINPVIGKEMFELLSLVIAALNGCELCVTSHEQAVINNGGTPARIFDAVRLGAVLKSVTVLL